MLPGRQAAHDVLITPAPVPPALMPITTTTPLAVTVSFTPGGNCTDIILQVLGNT